MLLKFYSPIRILILTIIILNLVSYVILSSGKKNNFQYFKSVQLSTKLKDLLINNSNKINSDNNNNININNHNTNKIVSDSVQLPFNYFSSISTNSKFRIFRTNDMLLNFKKSHLKKFLFDYFTNIADNNQLLILKNSKLRPTDILFYESILEEHKQRQIADYKYKLKQLQSNNIEKNFRSSNKIIKRSASNKSNIQKEIESKLFETTTTKTATTTQELENNINLEANDEPQQFCGETLYFVVEYYCSYVVGTGIYFANDEQNFDEFKIRRNSGKFFLKSKSN